MTEINYDAGQRAKNAVDELQQMLHTAEANSVNNYEEIVRLRKLHNDEHQRVIELEALLQRERERSRALTYAAEGLSPIDADRLREEVDEFARLGSFLAGAMNGFLQGGCTISDLRQALRFTANPNDDVGFDIMPLDEVRASLGLSK